jgi:hypothetical protein
VIGGALEDAGGERFAMRPGVIASISGSRRFDLGAGGWFAIGSLTASAASVGVEGGTRLTAFDLRLGAIAGRTFADTVTPYLLARAFGGPVFWTIDGEDVIGSDTRHVQLGAGLGVTTPLGLDAVVDVSLVGEQSASLSLSWRL